MGGLGGLDEQPLSSERCVLIFSIALVGACGGTKPQTLAIRTQSIF